MNFVQENDTRLKFNNDKKIRDMVLHIKNNTKYI